MRLTLAHPGDFCGCVRFKSDVVLYDKFDWNGVDALKDLWLVLGFE